MSLAFIKNHCSSTHCWNEARGFWQHSVGWVSEGTWKVILHFFENSSRVLCTLLLYLSRDYFWHISV